MITICMTYFVSLTLVNLSAALYSLRQQKFDRVKEIIVIDNNTRSGWEEIHQIIEEFKFPVPVRLLSFDHENPERTHSWSTNMAVRHAVTPWIFFSRADYVLDFDIVDKFMQVVDAKPEGWKGFVSSHVYHLHVDIGACNQLSWRLDGPKIFRRLPGVENDYMYIDAGVWLCRRDSFHSVSGLEESLSAWGHAQTHFQHKLYEAGVEFVTLQDTLFYHPQHAAPRDLAVANEQLAAQGIDLRKMWQRYHGGSPY